MSVPKELYGVTGEYNPPGGETLISFSRDEVDHQKIGSLQRSIASIGSNIQSFDAVNSLTCLVARSKSVLSAQEKKRAISVEKVGSDMGSEKSILDMVSKKPISRVSVRPSRVSRDTVVSDKWQFYIYVELRYLISM